MLRYSEDPVAFEWRSETLIGEQRTDPGVLIGPPSAYNNPIDVPTTPDYQLLGSFPFYNNQKDGPVPQSPFFFSNTIAKIPFYRSASGTGYFVQVSSDFDQFAPLRFYSTLAEFEGNYVAVEDKSSFEMYTITFDKNFGMAVPAFEFIDYQQRNTDAAFAQNPPLHFQVLCPVKASRYHYPPGLLTHLERLHRYGFPRGARVVDNRIRSRKPGSSVLIGQWFRNVGYNDPFLMFPIDSLWIEIPITGGKKAMQRFTIRNLLFEVGSVGSAYSGPYPEGGYALQTQADPSAVLVSAQVQASTGNPNRQYVVDMANRKVRVYHYVSGEWVEQTTNQNLAGEECVQVLIYKL